MVLYHRRNSLRTQQLMISIISQPITAITVYLRNQEQQQFLRIPKPSPGIPGIPKHFCRQRFSSTFVWCWRSMALPLQILWFEKGRFFFWNLKLHETSKMMEREEGQMGETNRCQDVFQGDPWSWKFVCFLVCFDFFWGGCLMSHLYIWWIRGKSQVLWLCPNLPLVDTKWRTETEKTYKLLLVNHYIYSYHTFHSICSKPQSRPTVKNAGGGVAPLGRPPASWGHHLHSTLDFDVDWWGSSSGWNFLFGMRKWYYSLYI